MTDDHIQVYDDERGVRIFRGIAITVDGIAAHRADGGPSACRMMISLLDDADGLGPSAFRWNPDLVVDLDRWVKDGAVVPARKAARRG